MWKKAAGNYYAVETVVVKDLLASGVPVMVIDTRPKKPKFDKGHIPGAVSIPDSKFEDFKGLLPQDQNVPLVYYCEGYT